MIITTWTNFHAFKYTHDITTSRSPFSKPPSVLNNFLICSLKIHYKINFTCFQQKHEKSFITLFLFFFIWSIQRIEFWKNRAKKKTTTKKKMVKSRKKCMQYAFVLFQLTYLPLYIFYRNLILISLAAVINTIVLRPYIHLLLVFH